MLHRSLPIVAMCLVDGDCPSSMRPLYPIWNPFHHQTACSPQKGAHCKEWSDCRVGIQQGEEGPVAAKEAKVMTNYALHYNQC